MKVQILETFECLDQNSPNSCHFWNNKSVFLQILHQSLVSWDITPLYFFSFNFINFRKKGAYQSTNLIKFHLSSQNVSEILHFDGLSAKKIQKELSLMTLKSGAKFKEKRTCSFKFDINNLVNFHPTTQKSERDYFCSKYMRFKLKKYRGVIFHDTEKWCKIWIHAE